MWGPLDFAFCFKHELIDNLFLHLFVINGIGRITARRTFNAAFLASGPFKTEDLTLWISALNTQWRKTRSYELYSLAWNSVPIVKLVPEDCFYILGLLLVVGSSNGLLASIGTDFEPIVELCISNRSKYQY